MTQATNINQAIRDELLLTLTTGTREEREEARASLARLNADMTAADKAERKTKAKAIDDTKAQEWQERNDNQLKATALREWVLGGGKREAFEAQWPTMKDELLRQKTIKAVNSIRPLQGF